MSSIDSEPGFKAFPAAELLTATESLEPDSPISDLESLLAIGGLIRTPNRHFKLGPNFDKAAFLERITEIIRQDGPSSASYLVRKAIGTRDLVVYDKKYLVSLLYTEADAGKFTIDIQQQDSGKVRVFDLAEPGSVEVMEEVGPIVDSITVQQAQTAPELVTTEESVTLPQTTLPQPVGQEKPAPQVQRTKHQPAKAVIQRSTSNDQSKQRSPKPAAQDALDKMMAEAFGGSQPLGKRKSRNRQRGRDK